MHLRYQEGHFCAPQISPDGILDLQTEEFKQNDVEIGGFGFDLLSNQMRRFRRHFDVH